MSKLEAKIAVITGGNSGIGLAIRLIRSEVYPDRQASLWASEPVG